MCHVKEIVCDRGRMDICSVQRLCLEEKREGSDVIPKSLKIHPPKWPKDAVCLIRGAQNLQDDSQLRNTDNIPWQNGCDVAGALNQKYQGYVVSVSSLTSLAIRKPKQEIVVDLEHNAEIFYEPGDAFYFVVPNVREETTGNFARPYNEWFLLMDGYYSLTKILLSFKSSQSIQCSRAHSVIDGISGGSGPKISYNCEISNYNKNAALPPYIPEISTLRYIFTWCLDIRRSPGRPLLRVLAECTENECQKRRILELCSAQGVEEFTKFVRQAGLSLVDFLLNFPSCRPTVERLIELLPRLLPRPYSVSCIRELWGKRMRFIFSLAHFNAIDGRRFHRFGLSSGWLATLKEKQQILMFLKESSRFRLPPPVYSSFDLTCVPLIMICTGTGLAPFLSFLQKLDFLKAGKYRVRRELYFGIRNIDDDCIYYRDIMRFVDENILSHVSLCESQPCNGSANKRYVQDVLQERGREISDILVQKNKDESHPALIFVCGSSKEMSRSVADAFLYIFSKFLNKNKDEAESCLKELRKSDQYIEDIW
ncbi:BMA-MTRR-1 [Dirofilaria immitis]|nr:BMA-MTRR-1 [Dirofilaria immitis]